MRRHLSALNDVPIYRVNLALSLRGVTRLGAFFLGFIDLSFFPP
jgi:hypothetical protein